MSIIYNRQCRHCKWRDDTICTRFQNDLVAARLNEVDCGSSGKGYEPEWLKSSVAGNPQPKKKSEPATRKQTKRGKKRDRKIVANPGPGYEGRFELGALEVVDPYDGSKLQAKGNVRHDILTRWRSRDQIDDAQFHAGIRLQGIWYRAQAGTVGTCLPENDRVDTSGIRDPIPSRIVAAQQQLAEVAALLGARDYELVRRVVCEGAKLDDVTKPKKHQLEYVGKRVRDALTDLAREWGLVLRNDRSLPITVFHAER